MQYLYLNHISLRYGQKVLLDELTLRVAKGDKIALVAKNGSGKSTLLEIIVGARRPDGDQAVIEISDQPRLAFLEQDPRFDSEKSVLEIICQSEDPRIQALKLFHEANLDGDAAKLQAATLRMDQTNSWDLHAKIESLSQKLGISDLHQKAKSMSGGQQKRIAILKIVLDEADFLILDEPTNHLDIDMIVWLENYLSRPNITILMVTHDRYFLDRICNRIEELNGGKLISYKGNYQDFLEKRALLEEHGKSRHEKLRKLMVNELEWIRRMPKARTTKAKARTQKFEKIREEVFSVNTPIHFNVPIQSRRLGSKIIEINRIGKSYGNQIVIKNFSYKFRKGEKVGLVGPNGSGKTTFLNILAGELSPSEGNVTIGETITIGYFRQAGLPVRKNKKVIDTIRDVAEYLPLSDGSKLTAEQLLERFLFDRSQQQIYISQLSGGEKRRLHLLTVLMRNPNFLILDEPTNDLDIVALNVLEEYLITFQGCLVIVTHDRYFLDKIAEHLFIIDHTGQIIDFNGTYTEWLSRDDNWEDVQQKTTPKREVSNSQIDRENRKNLKKIEKDLEKLEMKKNQIIRLFERDNLSGSEIDDLSTELDTTEAEIVRLEKEWLGLID